jgi:hypothetical protein
MTHEESDTPESRDAGVPGVPKARGEPLSEAYERRTKDLHDARGALAEAVSVLTAELKDARAEGAVVRAERDHLLQENRTMREHTDALVIEVKKKQERASVLEEALQAERDRVAVLSNMKVVRWSASIHGVVYRLRQRGGRRR